MRHPSRLAIILTAFVSCGGAGSQTPSSPRPSTTLADLEARYEHLMTEHGLAEWHEYTGEGNVAANALEQLQADERALFAEARPLAAAILARPDASAADRRLAELWRDGALGLDLVGDPEIARLSHHLEAMLDAHVFERNGQRVTRTDIRHLAMSTNADDRRDARALDSSLHREVADTARALLRRRVQVARERGITSYGDAMLRLRGIEPSVWDAFATTLETQTRTAYQALLDASRQRAGLATVTPADAQFVLVADTEWTSQRLPAEHAVDFARRALGALGFDLDQPPIRVIVREFSFGGQTLSIHVPDDVRTVVRPQAGQRFYSTLVHELGHALQATRTRADHALFKEYEWVPGLSSPGFDEGMAETFGTMFTEDDFLTRFTDFTPDERATLIAALRQNALVSLRAGLADVAFERAALADPEQDLDALQRRVDREIRRLDARDDTPPTWAATPFLATYPMYRQSYVIAAMVAAQVHAALRTRFGAAWLSTAIAQPVTETLLAPGQRVPWAERVVAGTGRPLTSDDLVAALTRH